ncbi:MAG TPA: hypothetical protein VEH56_08370 [Candidatus Saccharimonadales bacterium]|nr:hypothetical protein [Candidatus Saccharimonadales bacterium]
MSESTTRSPERKEGIYYCERHGVMNKGSDLKEKADQMARRA